MPAQRPDQRPHNRMRPLSFEWDAAANALSSILLRCGGTHVLCVVSVEEKVPRWMEQQRVTGGWLSAEYSMLPYSTSERSLRDVTKGKIDGRTQEIQRLIGRSLRTITRLEALGRRTLWVDCDVLAADGGTRTTAITGSYLALRLAIERLALKDPSLSEVLTGQVAATSVGIYQETTILDLCYLEDRDASVDMNVVMTQDGRLVEIGASGEEATFSRQDLDTLMDLAQKGIETLFAFQETAWLSRPVRT
ncbi:MAG: ribonuclease PH [Candidatus Methylacidiphilales bacterium]